MTSTSSMHEAGHSKPVLWDNPEGWGAEKGGRGSNWGNTYTPMTDSCPRMAKQPHFVISLQLKCKKLM